MLCWGAMWDLFIAGPLQSTLCPSWEHPVRCPASLGLPRVVVHQWEGPPSLLSLTKTCIIIFTGELGGSLQARCYGGGWSQSRKGAG